MPPSPSTPPDAAGPAGERASGGPDRVFLGWNEPALSLAARYLASALAGPDALDLRAHLLVVPGARASRRLVEILLEEADSRGLRLIPPQVVTTGALPERLYRPGQPLAGPLAGALAWSQALRDAPAAVVSRILPHRLDPSDSAGWDALGGMLQRLDSDISGSGYDFSQVAGIARSASGFDDGPRWGSLARVQQAQRTILDRAGLSDAGSTRMEAVRNGGLRLSGDVWLVGVVDLLPVTARMLFGLREDRIHALIHAPESEAANFTPLGVPAAAAWAGREIDLGNTPVVMGEGPGGQAEGVARILASWGGRFDSDGVVVGVPDPELVPFLERRLAQGGLRGRFAEGRPQGGTPPALLLDAVRGWLADSDFRSLASLLRHPDLDPRGPALADRFFNSHLPHRIRPPDPPSDVELDPSEAPGFSSDPGQASGSPEPQDGPPQLWPDEPPAPRDQPPTLPGLLATLERTLHPLRGTERPFSAWRDPVLQILIAVYGDQDLDRGNRSHRQTLAVLEGLRRAADALSSLPEPLDRTCAATDFLRLMLEELDGQSLPPDPDPGAVEMVGWLELHLDDSPGMIVTGMNEGSVPSSVVGDLFLPDSLRTRLGLMNNQARLGRDAYLLTTHLESRAAFGLTLARVGPGADPLRPSRLLLGGAGDAAAHRLLRFRRSTLPVEVAGAAAHGPGQGPGRDSGQAPQAPEQDPRVASLAAPPEPSLTFVKPDHFNVTDFRRILADPYVFVLERIHRLRDDHDDARELDPAGFGSLAHRVLEIFGARESEDPSLTPEAAEARMKTCLDEVAGSRFGSNALPAVRIQIRHLEARLLAVARWHASAMAEGWRVAAVETSLLGPDGERRNVPLETPYGPTAVRGVIDRVDVHPESGRWRLIDYKSSESGSDPVKLHLRGKRENGNWTDFQLPLYRFILPHLELSVSTPLPPDPFRSDLVEVGYVILPKSLEEAGWRPADFQPHELDAAIRTAGEIAGVLESGVVEFDRIRADQALHRESPLRALLGLAGLPPDPGEEPMDDAGGAE